MQEMKPMVSDRKLANAVGGKSARACDNCVRKRARWYCTADDAFLCQSCDSSVHSANPLARRHERVRLKNSSDVESKTRFDQIDSSLPCWHQGFTRKARTPRQKKHGKLSNPLRLVPEIGNEEQSHEEDEELLLYRVPILDTLEVAVNAGEKDAEYSSLFGSESRADFGRELNHLEGILPSELDLADFAADVESLLGKGLEDESFDMEGLGLLDCDESVRELRECGMWSERVKVEDEEIGEVAMAEEHHHHQIHGGFDLGREAFELSFDYGSPVTCEEGEEEEENKEQIFMNNFEKCKVENSKTFLKLHYDGVMSAWDDHKSPWTTGERPNLSSGNCWPDSTLGTSGAMHAYGEMGRTSGHVSAAMADGGREARVSRYREKRRTRLFSKKIRYEVRKLNAEKRPRMKGRFVKRASFMASAFPLLNK